MSLRPPYSAFLLATILISALVARLWDLWGYAPTMDDMELMIIAAAGDWAEVWRRALAEIQTPFAWFLRHMLTWFAPGIPAQRLLSVFAGIMAVFGMFRLGAVLGGTALGLLCAAMMAFLPSAMLASLTLRNYAFLIAFLVWALVFFFRWQQQGRIRNMAAYSGCMLFACAMNFSGFLVAAACGLAEGGRLLHLKRVRHFLILCAFYLPLTALSALLYCYYLTPGAALGIWNRFLEVTGSPTPFPRDVGTISLLILSYFFPYPLLAVHPDFEPWFLLTQPFMLISGFALLLLYIAGLVRMRRAAPEAFTLTCVMWGVAMLALFTKLYPFTASRHNDYFLPFFILPLGFLLMPLVQRALMTRAGTGIFAAFVILITAGNEPLLRYENDLAFRQADLDAGQHYLDSHIAPGDAIVTEWVGAYPFLLYAKDAGKTPYDNFPDVPYLHGTTILAPAGTPLRPYSSWRPFHDTLAQRLEQGIVTPENQVWFVDYGWKNREIWTLMECAQAHPLMEHFFSREGIVIFSIQAQALSAFLTNTSVWERCYKDYRPLVTSTPFHAVPVPN